MIPNDYCVALPISISQKLSSPTERSTALTFLNIERKKKEEKELNWSTYSKSQIWRRASEQEQASNAELQSSKFQF